MRTLREELDAYQEKVDGLEGVLRKEREQIESMISPEEMDARFKKLRDQQEEELRRLQEEHDNQLQQIEEVWKALFTFI